MSLSLAVQGSLLVIEPDLLHSHLFLVHLFGSVRIYSGHWIQQLEYDAPDSEKDTNAGYHLVDRR